MAKFQIENTMIERRIMLLMGNSFLGYTGPTASHEMREGG